MSALPDVLRVEIAPSAWSVARLLRRRAAVVSLVFLVLLTIASLTAPWIAPFDPRSQDVTRVLSGPTWHNLLGTDTLGRDVLSRIIYGGRRSLLSVVEGLAVVIAAGVPLGLVAGYAGGWADWVISRAAEVLLAVPGIILVLVVLAVVPQNENVAMVAFGLIGAPVLVRVVRAASLRVREDLYVAAARVSGLSHPRIVIRHVLPRVAGPIVVQASLFAAYALLFETSIAYLGLTADPTAPTWGGMVGEASAVIQQQEWLLIPSGLVIALTVLAFGLLGDAVRDTLAPTAASETPGGRRTRLTELEPSAVDEGVAHGGPLLAVRDLAVALVDAGGTTAVVEGVSFDVLPGETVGLVGESGCGKSVTAHALIRLLPPVLRLTQGSVHWEGGDISRLPDRDFDRLRGGAFAYVSQEAQASLDPTFTVGSQLVEAIRHHEPLSRRDGRLRAIELLRLVGLPAPDEVARLRAYELSGGMAQRVAIALALAGRPKLLVADEPTTALDVTVQAEVLGLLRELQSETGLSILLISHDWGVIADLCDRTLVMYAGQLVEAASAQSLFDRPLHPYTLGLRDSHPSLAFRGRALTTMPGSVPSPGRWPEGCRFASRCGFAASECTSGAIPFLTVEPGRKSRCIRVEDIFPTAPV